jgi:hypothetical protein
LIGLQALPPRWALSVLLLLVATTAVTAQRTEAPEDPYTKGDAEAWAAAGYLAPAPFAWTGKYDTDDIEDALGVPLRWVETAHFRIGSSLPEIRLTSNERDGVRDELKRLAARLPRVKISTRTLDPWLRLHLFAQRTEELHSDLCRRLRVTDADFPQEFDGDYSPPADGGRYSGEGPHLGMPGKFTLLLLDKRASLGRYRERFTSQTVDTVVRGAYFDPVAMTVATSSELLKESWPDDEDEPMPEALMHSHVAFHVSQSLVLAYRYYWFSLPFWLPEGVAHHYRRQAEARWNHFGSIDSQEYRFEEGDPPWPARVRARVKHDFYPKAEELMSWWFGEPRSLADHMMIWSRVDFLMSRPEEEFATFMAVLNDHPRTPDWRLSPEQVLERQAKALASGFQLDAAGFDEAWSEWVLDTYPKD